MSRFWRDVGTATGLNQTTFNIICVLEIIAAVAITAGAGAARLSRSEPKQVEDSVSPGLA